MPPADSRVRRFEEQIGGRVYHIEAAQVGTHRWRAQIARRPGMPTALMPFYGATADEAASLLTAWLARAHRNATNTL
ncbi:MAG: hypothetical protein HYS05_00310 [Acidobacteria bacterium]|nr:hypothetical protein [Acidobacteriota bacterium]